MKVLSMDELEQVHGGRFSGAYQTEALQFLKEHMDEKTFDLIMKKDSKKPYVPAKIFLSPSDWEKYAWIEEHGSLDGFMG